jgi:phage terminase large subunit
MLPATELEIKTPRWALPLLEPARYKGAKGGRGSGKSHFFAELAVEEMLIDPDLPFVCLREVQKSLQYSAKRLIEQKIWALGVSSSFRITKFEIHRIGGEGLFIFQGMQDHTADSIKSLEGFKRAWFEEAQNCSSRSLKLLKPTIREEGSELWFSWNPEQAEDPVDSFFLQDQPDNAILVHTNLNDNPFASQVLIDEMRGDRERLSDEDFAHIWEGAYNTKSKSLVFADKYKIEEFEPSEDWGSPYHGLDFGFAQDPTTANRVWIHNDRLYIEYEANKVGLELDDTADYITTRIPNIEQYVIRADSARPESISYLKRHGLPKIEGVEKWSGSVEDGIEHMRSYKEIIIHPRCEQTKREFRLYSYKVDKRTGDILPKIIDANNHHIDGIRYSLSPLIKAQRYTEPIQTGFINI